MQRSIGIDWNPIKPALVTEAPPKGFEIKIVPGNKRPEQKIGCRTRGKGQTPAMPIGLGGKAKTYTDTILVNGRKQTVQRYVNETAGPARPMLWDAEQVITPRATRAGEVQTRRHVKDKECRTVRLSETANAARLARKGETHDDMKWRNSKGKRPKQELSAETRLMRAIFGI